MTSQTVSNTKVCQLVSNPDNGPRLYSAFNLLTYMPRFHSLISRRQTSGFKIESHGECAHRKTRQCLPIQSSHGHFSGCRGPLRICGILLQPYIPGKATLLLDMLGVNSDRRHLQHAVLGADDSYGTSKVPLGKGPVGVLFPPLLAED